MKDAHQLRIITLELSEANALVERWHRHHDPVAGHKFSLGVCIWPFHPQTEVIGAAIVGRPVARALQDGWTLEVLRVATDGTKNACSALYGACRRATFALGYRKLVTYTLNTEPGSSLKGAGWKCLGEAGGARGIARRAPAWTRPRRR